MAYYLILTAIGYGTLWIVTAMLGTLTAKTFRQWHAEHDSSLSRKTRSAIIIRDTAAVAACILGPLTSGLWFLLDCLAWKFVYSSEVCEILDDRRFP
jgi:hypothetical protein